MLYVNHHTFLYIHLILELFQQCGISNLYQNVPSMILLEVQLVEFYWVVHHKQYNKGLKTQSLAGFEG